MNTSLATETFGVPPLAILLANSPKPDTSAQEFVRLLNSAFVVGCSVQHAGQMLALLGQNDAADVKQDILAGFSFRLLGSARKTYYHYVMRHSRSETAIVITVERQGKAVVLVEWSEFELPVLKT
ncbi:MAG TPA: hypothetical protein VHP58_03330 [Alphaproteobacteria bacterium]|nr:hypothetical protein [Alphaproteobacteria bacterium]